MVDVSSALGTVTSVQHALSVLATLSLTSYIWPEQACVKDGDTFDFIVIGAGTAGCVVAGRLAEDRTRKVLLIEAGGDPPFESVTPSMFQFLTKSKYDWNYTSEDNPWLEGSNVNDTINLTRGKLLGGSGSLNGMIFVRGNPHDFDSWAELLNDSNWNWNNVLPTYIKMERLEDEEVLQSSTGIYHGTEGPTGIQRQPYEDLVPLLEAFEEVGKGNRLDINGNETLGYTQSMYTIADQVRQSSAYVYISPKKDWDNLFVMKNTLATRIIFDEEKNAVGVKLVTESNEEIVVKSSREIILSAGVFNSPQILMLSGIGPKEHLNALNIDVIADLPVGKNLEDQTAVILSHKIPIPAAAPQKPWDFPAHMFAGYVAINESQTYPDYQVLNLAMPSNPEFPFDFLAFFLGLNKEFSKQLTESGTNTLVTVLYHLHPKSRGQVLLRSADPTDAPMIYSNTFGEEEDLDDIVTFMKDFIGVDNSTYFQSVGAELVLPDLPGCPNAEKRSTEYWRCYARSLMVTSYHQSSSCSMGSVLDSRLRVLGVQKLRVVDVSAMPKAPSGNTNAATTMLGEKAAEMIIKDNQ